jgi:3-phenylpropionate/trans-cinnamate dioxygenase ferredoxin reductase component
LTISSASYDGRVVVVGGGHAGGELVASLRSQGHLGEIMLISAESHLPYQRPPLSKAYLSDQISKDKLLMRPAEFYASQRIDTRLDTRVVSIDRAAKAVTLAEGEIVPYGRLALTTGTRPRPLEIPGTQLKGVHYLRTIDDVLRIRGELSHIDELVIIGGGFIGLEVAAICRKLGKNVSILESADRLMSRVSSQTISMFYQSYHEKHGVHIYLRTHVKSLIGESSRVQQVDCRDGFTLRAQLVIIGIGVLPNIELALTAGLPCDGGIIVDEFARTADRDVVAAGDCTNHPNSLLGRRMRLESVHNAVEQARTAAATLCDHERRYSQIPWFWSDQYDLKLQMVGVPVGHDAEIVRGDIASAAFSVFYFKGGSLQAVDSVNRAPDHMLARRFLAARTPLTEAQAANPQFDLKSIR